MSCHLVPVLSITLNCGLMHRIDDHDIINIKQFIQENRVDVDYIMLINVLTPIVNILIVK